VFDTDFFQKLITLVSFVLSLALVHFPLLEKARTTPILVKSSQ